MLAFLDRHDRRETTSTTDQRPQDTRDRSRGPTRAQEATEHSANPDFAGLVRNHFRVIQAAHHSENWQDIPPRVGDQIDKIITNLKPPLPGEGLRRKLTSAADDFKSAILVAVQSHVEECASTARTEIQQLDHGDWERAEGLARVRYERRFTSRARPETLRVATRDLNRIRTDGWQRPRHTARPQPHNTAGTETTVNNRFGALDTDDDGDTDDGAGSEGVEAAAFRAPLPAAPQRRKRAGHPTSTPSKKPNRTAPAPRDTEIGDTATDVSSMTESIDADTDDAIPGTAPPTRPYPKVLIGAAQNRARWNIETPPASVSNLIVADSNGISWRDIDVPENTVVYALRGARLGDAARLAPMISDVKEFRTVIFCLGANDRANDPSETIATLRKIHLWSTRCDKQVFIAGLPTFTNTSAQEQATMRTINQTMADFFDHNYVPPVAENLVKVVDPHTYGIHYSTETAQAILDTLLPYLN